MLNSGDHYVRRKREVFQVLVDTPRGTPGYDTLKTLRVLQHGDDLLQLNTNLLLVG